jgi:hypothetical protein
MMRKTAALWLTAMAVALCFGLKLAQAQQQQEPSDKSATSTTQENKPKPEPMPDQPEKPVHAYRVDFSLNELEDGKKINTRHYSMHVNTGDRNQVKISTGTRVPGEAAATSGVPVEAQSDFVNISTHIYCRVQERGDEVLLAVESVISNVLTAPKVRPVNRDFDIVGSTVATLGKPIVIGSVDDPTSNHEFQLEVTATKVK